MTDKTWTVTLKTDTSTWATVSGIKAATHTEAIDIALRTVPSGVFVSVE